MFEWFKKKIAIRTSEGRVVRLPEAHVVIHFGEIGVPKDLCLACMWLRIADRHGCQVPVELRSQVIGEMTPEQIAQAENLARDWKPTVINSTPGQR